MVAKNEAIVEQVLRTLAEAHPTLRTRKELLSAEGDIWHIALTDTAGKNVIDIVVEYFDRVSLRDGTVVLEGDEEEIALRIEWILAQVSRLVQ